MSKIDFAAALDLVKAAFPRMNDRLQRVYAGCVRSDVMERGMTADESIAALKSLRAEAAADDRKLRAMLRERFGAGKYRIDVADDVHAYGPMPNAVHIEGWHLVGGKRDILRNPEMFF